MIVTLKIEDSTYEAYRGMDPKGKAESTLVAQVEKHKDSDPRERELVFNPSQRVELEKLLGGTLTRPDDILDSVRSALSLDVGGERIIIQEHQARKIANSARFHDASPSEVIRNRVELALKAVLEG